MSDGYIKFNDLLTAVGNMLKEMGSKEVTVKADDYDLSGFCDKLYESAYEKGKHDAIASYGCEGCINYDLDPFTHPCWSCARLKIDYYKNKKGDSK
jgi:hypothetical protein